MNNTIYRQMAIDSINNHFGFNIEEEYGSAVQEVINNLPPAEPEIIRCKDCKYSYMHYPWGEDFFGSMRCMLLRSEFSVNSDLSVQEDDYCSRAERRGTPLW